MKSYKDLSREAVLNAPDGAMWAAIEQRDFKLRRFYKIQNKKLRVYADEWSDSSYGDIISAQNGERIYFIPLPNVKIPWEATEDSVCPVPGHFEILHWIDGNEIPITHTWNAQNVRWYKLDRNNISAYQIFDQDYMREKDANKFDEDQIGKSMEDAALSSIDDQAIDRALNLQSISIRMPVQPLDDLKAIAKAKGLGCQTPIKLQLQQFAASEASQLVGQSIIFDNDDYGILRKLKLLNHICEQFPLIADCAKAAMERLVEKWVGK